MGWRYPYGSKNFQKSVEKISKELENQYGISLSHTRILKQKVFTSYYNSSFSGCTGKCKVDGTGQIDIAIADWEQRDANKIILNSTNVSKSFDLCIGYTRNREDLERLLNN